MNTAELALLIRQETPADADAITRLHERAFGPGRFARTAFRLREGGLVLPDLNLSALVGTLLVGSVKQSPIRIGAEPALMLGPLAVEPAFEGRGIGAALMARALDVARAGGHGFVILVGDEPYYRRFGFARVPPGRLDLPGPVDPARVLAHELVPGVGKTMAGRVTPRRA